MSVPRVRGDYEQLTQVAQAFGAEADQLHAQLQHLTQAKNSLQGGEWLGAGAQKFYAEMEMAVLPALKRLAQALQQAQHVTRQISQVLRQAEADAAACFRLSDSSSDGGGGVSASAAAHAGLCAKSSPPPGITIEGQTPFVVFQAEKGQGWAGPEKAAIEEGLRATATRLSKTINENNYKLWQLGELAHYQPISAEVAFKQVYGGPIPFTRVAEAKSSAYMITTETEYGIKVYSTTSPAEITPRLAVHELGHAFNNAAGKQAQKVPAHLLRPIIRGVDDKGNPVAWIEHESDDDNDRYFGYAGKALVWQFGYGTEMPGSEEFADMYLGWVYGQWDDNEAGKARRNYMNQTMDKFLSDMEP